MIFSNCTLLEAGILAKPEALPYVLSQSRRGEGAPGAQVSNMARPSSKKSPGKPVRLGPYDPDLSGPIQRPYPGLRSPNAKAIRKAVKEVIRQRALSTET